MGVLSEDGGASQLAGGLHDALAIASQFQEITFTRYERWVLPLDGSIFWLPQLPLRVRGFLHHDETVQQNEDETAAPANITFTCAERIDQFESSPTNIIYVARHGGFRYAFSALHGRDWQAGLWHYTGSSILPAMATQLLDNPAVLDPGQAVVSNSLPAWLALNTYAPPAVLTDWFQSSGITLYPSFLVPTNLPPPYGVVHIDADSRAVQASPYIDPNTRSHWLSTVDRVRITLYGLQNDAANDFVDFVGQYATLTRAFGIMSPWPAICDGKRAQPELQSIAMQKIVTFTVNYNQTRIQTIAQQLIKQALATVVFNPN